MVTAVGDALLEFEWEVAADYGWQMRPAELSSGERAADVELMKRQALLALMGKPGQNQAQPDYYLVEAQREPRTRYCPLNRDHAALFRIFANTEPSQDGVIAFARQYGFLGAPAVAQNFGFQTGAVTTLVRDEDGTRRAFG